MLLIFKANVISFIVADKKYLYCELNEKKKKITILYIKTFCCTFSISIKYLQTRGGSLVRSLAIRLNFELKKLKGK